MGTQDAEDLGSIAEAGGGTPRTTARARPPGQGPEAVEPVVPLLPLGILEMTVAAGALALVGSLRMSARRARVAPG